jgi:hypothetical protein
MRTLEQRLHTVNNTVRKEAQIYFSQLLKAGQSREMITDMVIEKALRDYDNQLKINSIEKAPEWKDEKLISWMVDMQRGYTEGHLSGVNAGKSAMTPSKTVVVKKTDSLKKLKSVLKDVEKHGMEVTNLEIKDKKKKIKLK